MLATDFVETITTTFPKLDWTERGLVNLRNVHTLLTERKEGQDLTEDIWNEIEQQFLNRLQYLNNYGSDKWRVQLGSDWGNKFNFGLLWSFNGQPSMNGLLQFNGVRTVAASVVLGELTWWSIHT